MLPRSGPQDRSFGRLRPVLYSTPAVGYEIADDDEAAVYVHALFAAADRDLGVLEANFCTLPARVLGLLGDAEWNRRVATDVETGTLDAHLAQRLGPDVARRVEDEEVEVVKQEEEVVFVKEVAAGASSSSSTTTPNANPNSSNKPSARERLALLKGLLDDELISMMDYESKKQEILREL